MGVALPAVPAGGAATSSAVVMTARTERRIHKLFLLGSRPAPTASGDVDEAVGDSIEVIVDAGTATMRGQELRRAAWRGLGIVLAISGGAIAFEPPDTPPDLALRDGRVAFVGKIVALTLNARSEVSGSVTATAKVEVARCLYGRECRSRTLDLSYVLETQEDRTLGIDLFLGEQYLIVLRHEQGARLRFEASWKTGMDLAYRWTLHLGVGPDIDLRNAWLPGLVQRISVDRLDQLAADRRARLIRGRSKVK